MIHLLRRYAPVVRYLPPRWFLIVLGSIVLVLAALASASMVAVRDSFPQTEGEVSLPSLRGPVTVTRDAHGIPEIRADNAEDLFTAQGYVHAQERFFEMEVRRHTTAGRLAELFGDDQFETDAVIRTMGWRRVADAEVKQLPTETRRFLDAYATGVNHYLATHGNEPALELKLLGLQGLDHEIEPWTAVDSVAWLKAMAWNLDGNMNDEVLHAAMIDQVGPTRAAQLFPTPRPDLFDPIVQHGDVRDGRFDPQGGGPRGPASGTNGRELDALLAAQRALDAVPAMIAPTRQGAGIGSNSWAVSGDRTASGLPILANDPHLGTSVPSTFLQMRLRCTTVDRDCPFDVGGYSFSGMPGIIIGHNRDIAWGLTVPYVDTQDLYIEQIDAGGRARRASGSEEVVTRVETIRSSSGATREISIRSTSNGPLVSDVGLGEGARAGVGNGGDATGADEYAVALRWAALDPSESVRAILALNAASNFAEFRDAARLLKSPAQNLMYADRAGNIGYQLPGAIPDRAVGDGTTPQQAWRPDVAWEGYVPFDELPYAYNPPEGYLVAANQQIIDAERPQQAGNSFGFRSQPIATALASREDWDMDATVELLGNEEVWWAKELVPALVAAQPLEPWVVDGQRVLADWDQRSDPDSAGMAFFALAVRQVVQRTFGDEIPADLGPGQGNDQYFAVLQAIIDEPEDPWWDDITTPQVESRDQILSEALLAARKEATALMARDPKGWQWSKLHHITLEHQTLGQSGIAPIEALFNTDRRAVGGGSAVVSAWGWDSRGSDFSVASGPTMKMAVDFADLDNSRWVNQSGTSGHAFHPHYSDQFGMILANDLYRWAWSRPADPDGELDTLILRPSD